MLHLTCKAIHCTSWQSTANNIILKNKNKKNFFLKHKLLDFSCLFFFYKSKNANKIEFGKNSQTAYCLKLSYVQRK